MNRFRSGASRCRIARGSGYLLALVILSGGCAGRIEHDLPLAHDIAADPLRGVVVGTIGILPDTQFNPPWQEWSMYTYRSLDNSSLEGVITSAFRWNPYYMWGSMSRCTDDGLVRDCGRVFALLLPAGDYEFTQVRPAMMDEISSSEQGTAVRYRELTGYRFSVRAGEAVYIGNLLSRICVAGGRRGHGPWLAVGDVDDFSARDIPVARARYPALRDLSIAVRPMSGQPWHWRHPRVKAEVDVPECSDDPKISGKYLRNSRMQAR